MASDASSSGSVAYNVYLPSSTRALAYPIRISEDAKVNDMIDKICEHRVFRHAVETGEVYLYKCGTLFNNPSKEDRYKEALKWLHIQPRGSAMDAIDRLKKHFPDGPAPEENGLIDVIAATDSILEMSDNLHPLPGTAAFTVSKERLALAEKLGTLPSPSECVSSAGGVEKCNESNGIHAHRPATNCGPPTFLFNPILAELKHRLDHLSLDEYEPRSFTLDRSHSFLSLASMFYKTEKAREDALKQLTNELIGIVARKIATETGAMPDAVWGDPPVMIKEDKNEYGIGGNATLQGLMSYGKILGQSKYSTLIGKSNCPVIIFGLMGTQLEISTAVFVDGIYVDKLLSLELHFGSSEADSVLRLGRVMSALSDAVFDLIDYYNKLLPGPSSASPQSQPSKSGPAEPEPSEAEESPAHLFPDPVLMGDHSKPKLVYIGKLSRSGMRLDISRMGSLGEDERRYGLYLAKMGDEGREVVVKFTSRYNDRAHRVLAERGLAPALHLCAPVLGGLYMVVMDYVQGASGLAIDKKYGHEVYDDMKLAIELLHAKDLVFGDLRLQNVICKPEGRAVLIDFDWVGKHRVDRYSAALDEKLNCWPDGVGRRTIMDKAYDLALLERVRKYLYGIERLP